MILLDIFPWKLHSSIWDKEGDKRWYIQRWRNEVVDTEADNNCKKTRGRT